MKAVKARPNKLRPSRLRRQPRLQLAQLPDEADVRLRARPRARDVGERGVDGEAARQQVRDDDGDGARGAALAVHEDRSAAGERVGDFLLRSDALCR